MRIIGGEAKGRPIPSPRGCRLRPTADRVRESLFSQLEPVAETSVLDLFAGTGSVGLEALSRGARYAVFVERDRRLCESLRRHLDRLGFQGRAEVLPLDEAAARRRMAIREECFDTVFADPPYGEGYLARMIPWWLGGLALAQDGLWVVQHSVRETLPDLPAEALQVLVQRRYGDTLLTFMKRRQERTT